MQKSYRMSRRVGGARGRVHVGCASNRYPCGRSLHRLPRNVSIVGGGRDLALAEKLGDHRQAFCERESPGREAVAKILDWVGDVRRSLE